MPEEKLAQKWSRRNEAPGNICSGSRGLIGCGGRKSKSIFAPVTSLRSDERSKKALLCLNQLRMFDVNPCRLIPWSLGGSNPRSRADFHIIHPRLSRTELD
jgi:hypothetical protein